MAGKGVVGGDTAAAWINTSNVDGEMEDRGLNLRVDMRAREERERGTKVIRKRMKGTNDARGVFKQHAPLTLPTPKAGL